MSDASEVGIEAAIRYVERPDLLLAEFPDQAARLQVLRAIESAIERAERENSLAWQLHQLRRSKQERVGTLAGAQRISAFLTHGQAR